MTEHTRKAYDDMTREELERELREAFLDTDLIDEPLNDELERMRETLNRKWPLEYLYTPEESWAHFLEDNAEELAPFLSPKTDAEAGFPTEKTGRVRHRTVPALLRRVLIAAAAVLILAGAVLAADPLGLWAWVPHWNAAAGRYEPLPEELAGRPIPAALGALGIAEPVYPAWLPEGFALAESHISEDPLVLMEQYVCGDRVFSVTVTPIKGFQNAVYPGGGETYRVYGAGSAIHYLFRNEGAITAVWYTEHYATSVSGNLTLEEAARIIDSMYGSSEGGYFS